MGAGRCHYKSFLPLISLIYVFRYFTTYQKKTISLISHFKCMDIFSLSTCVCVYTMSIYHIYIAGEILLAQVHVYFLITGTYSSVKIKSFEFIMANFCKFAHTHVHVFYSFLGTWIISQFLKLLLSNLRREDNNSSVFFQGYMKILF